MNVPLLLSGAFIQQREHSDARLRPYGGMDNVVFPHLLRLSTRISDSGQAGGTRQHKYDALHTLMRTSATHLQKQQEVLLELGHSGPDITA